MPASYQSNRYAKYLLESLTNLPYGADGGDPDAPCPRTDAGGDRRAANDGGGGIAATRAGAARARTAGDGQGRSLGPERGGDRALERADPGDGAALAGRVP